MFFYNLASSFQGWVSTYYFQSSLCLVCMLLNKFVSNLTSNVTVHGKISHIAHKIIFLLKATITKYDLWTTDPANLKFLAPVGLKIWAKMYPDHWY